jgi:hypothetical protein
MNHLAQPALGEQKNAEENDDRVDDNDQEIVLKFYRVFSVTPAFGLVF